MSEQNEVKVQSKQTAKPGMLENDSDKVTAVEKSESSKAVKVKDPRKVELGKRLAKISREAKERKARQRSKVENKQSPKENRTRVRFAKEITDYIDFRYFIGGVTLVATLGGLYYSYKRDKREIKEEKDSQAYKFVNNVKEKNDGSTSQGREKKNAKRSTKVFY